MVTLASPSVDDLVASLDPEQRAAALLPDGPAQIIAPAGSGKTTTLIARLGVLVGRGVAPERICVLTFNRDAAADLAERLRTRLAAHVPGAERIEVRTLHALALRILADAGRSTRVVADRLPLIRAARRRVLAVSPADAPPLPAAEELDGILSLWKIEARPPGSELRAVFATYGGLLAARGAIDFDDLVTGAADLLERDPAVRDRWQQRFSHVLVDEFQDVDAAQLRMARFIAAPHDNLFVVGDDDQTIYAWRLADVRRILTFVELYPTARRIQLATNYRCPVDVVTASRALVGVNQERFVKRIDPSPSRTDDGPDTVVACSTAGHDWPDALVALALREVRTNGGCCFLARTRAELEPVSVALLRAGVPHHSSVPPLVEHPRIAALADDLRSTDAGRPPFALLRTLRAGRGWARSGSDDALGEEDHAALDAFLGWSVGFRGIRAFLAAFDTARSRIAALRQPDARIELVTVHASKGREWPTVLLLGWEQDRFPNRRSLTDALDPARALEEERRLAYVALTRATQRAILCFDPAKPSRFLSEMGANPV
ncbi:MAG: ATP-dependent helicase [Chloroflexota bacterium]